MHQWNWLTLGDCGSSWLSWGFLGLHKELQFLNLFWPVQIIVVLIVFRWSCAFREAWECPDLYGCASMFLSTFQWTTYFPWFPEHIRGYWGLYGYFPLPFVIFSVPRWHISMVIVVCARALWYNWMCSGLPDCILASVTDTTFHVHFLVFVTVPWWFWAHIAASEHPLCSVGSQGFAWGFPGKPEKHLILRGSSGDYDNALMFLGTLRMSW